MFSEAHMGVLKEYTHSMAFVIQHQISTRKENTPLRWAVNPFTYGLVKCGIFSYPIDWVIDNSLEDFQAQEII